MYYSFFRKSSYALTAKLLMISDWLQKAAEYIWEAIAPIKTGCKTLAIANVIARKIYLLK